MARCSRCGRSISGFGFGRRLCPWCQQAESSARGEDVETQRVEPVPWRQASTDTRLVTQIIFGLNVAVFVGMLLAGAGLMGGSSRMALDWGANFGPLTLSGQWWRLVTSCFVHFGIMHIGFNMWCLWSLGELAERLYGRVTFAVLYLLCGIGGSLGSIAWHSMPVVSAGASGAIFGIAGAIIASLKLGNTTNRWMANNILRSLMVFVGFNVVIGAASGITDNACHIGGLLTGLIVGALIAKLAPPNPQCQDWVCSYGGSPAVGLGSSVAWQSPRVAYTRCAYPWWRAGNGLLANGRPANGNAAHRGGAHRTT